MKKILVLLTIATISACTHENTNFIRFGELKDSYDHLQYNYIETGKDVIINEHNSLRATYGFQSEASEKEFDVQNKYEDYWRLDYEIRW